MEDKEFNEKLIQMVPEAKPGYEGEKRIYDEGEEPGSTIIVEDVLMPLVYKALEDGDENLLSEFRTWLEEVASLKDEVCEEIIYICVFEQAFSEKKLEELKKKAFGPLATAYLKTTIFGDEENPPRI